MHRLRTLPTDEMRATIADRYRQSTSEPFR